VNRRALGIAVAVAIAAAAFQPFYLRIYTTNRAGLATALTELPYRKLPGMRQFLIDVRARTRDGDTIAIAAPLHRAPLWQGGYDYLFQRSRYLLAGRLVVPLRGEDDRPRPENLTTATHIACFHCTSTAPGFVEIWRGRDGALLRRAR
jgi:hypothetical protein